MKTQALLRNLVCALMIACATLISFNGNSKNILPTMVEEIEKGDVSDDEVRRYMNRHGYEVYEIIYSGEGFNRIVYTQYDYQTLVYVSDSKIQNHENIQI